MPKINREEYEVLKGLDDKWKWIARNNMYGAKLEAHTSRPYKMIDSHWSNGDMTLELLGGEHLFQAIQWEDEEPYNIKELIEEYESGETEIPKINREEYEHIDWLLKRVKKEIKRKDEILGLLDWNTRQADRLSGQIEAFGHIEMLINEIGKPSYFRNKHRGSE